MDLSRYALGLVILIGSELVVAACALLIIRRPRRSPIEKGERYCPPQSTEGAMPYIDINPHRRSPSRRPYIVLGILTIVTAVVIFLAVAAA